MKLLSLTLLASAALSFAKPVPPTEKFLYNATLISGGPVVIGATPSGDRKIIAITGGSFTGPKLTGKVLPGLANVVTSQGLQKADATYVLQTTDGALIVVTEKAVLPNIQVTYETASTKYGWVNNITAWGTGSETNAQASLNFWQIG